MSARPPKGDIRDCIRFAPADIPIEQPSKFTFIVNLKAAKELGVTVPSQLLGLADQLIE